MLRSKQTLIPNRRQRYIILVIFDQRRKLEVNISEINKNSERNRQFFTLLCSKSYYAAMWHNATTETIHHLIN